MNDEDLQKLTDTLHSMLCSETVDLEYGRYGAGNLISWSTLTKGVKAVLIEAKSMNENAVADFAVWVDAQRFQPGAYNMSEMVEMYYKTRGLE